MCSLEERGLLRCCLLEFCRTGLNFPPCHHEGIVGVALLRPTLALGEGVQPVGKVFGTLGVGAQYRGNDLRTGFHAAGLHGVGELLAEQPDHFFAGVGLLRQFLAGEQADDALFGAQHAFCRQCCHRGVFGACQRICIARALAINPKFIVCDEPVSALDVSIQAQILNLLMDLQDEMGLTYMFITHDLSVVKHISSEIMVMYLGRCVEYAPANELFENPVHPYTKALLSAIPIPDISMRGKNIQTIRGEVSSPINPKPGCRFAPRCDFACESCTAADIPLRQCGPNHYVACCCAGE